MLQRLFSSIAGAAALTGALAMAAPAQAAAEVVRTYASPTAFIAQTATVPAGYETVYLSGVLPDLPAAPAAAPDTETQAMSVFGKIRGVLEKIGLSESNVVSMTIYLTAAPGAERMDFQGMMNAYKKFYGTPEQMNRPTRSTVQVAALAAPAALIEVEVTAVRPPKK